MSSNESPETLSRLVEYTRTVLLGGDADGLTPETPLLEWGVLDSLKTARLVGWIRDEFGVRVPPTKMNGANFRDLNSIAALVESLRDPAGV
ncbi:acyl carrier protein [Micromonospora auratinigra]|uniref:Acyl carrier protein n=1 Tax=Micromonospora auratinigra TaxID=261654 RepID=A0A1A8ZG28_9ACTN|nr:acyl carrier protein [Micromonospora auratinigra]SBT42793.1 Acyl carrier protein [Micromonospora auratinigra]